MFFVLAESMVAKVRNVNAILIPVHRGNKMPLLALVFLSNPEPRRTASRVKKRVNLANAVDPTAFG
jgi:hypothetical protein